MVFNCMNLAHIFTIRTTSPLTEQTNKALLDQFGARDAGRLQISKVFEILGRSIDLFFNHFS